MNSLFILVTATIAFVFGYRFFAKMLGFGVFRLQSNYSTPAHTLADGRDYVATNRSLLLAQHAAGVAGIITVAGPMIALQWGWIPAFLWLVIGTTVAAGTYGLGALWLASHTPGQPLGAIASGLVGRLTRYGFYAAAMIAIVLFNALVAFGAASVLATHGAAALTVVTLVLLAPLLGRVLAGRHGIDLIPVVLVTLVSALALLWLLHRWPITMSGALNFNVSGNSVATLSASGVWLTLIYTNAYFSLRAPMQRRSQPHGFGSALLFAVLMIVFLAALLAGRPALVAPEFHAVADAPAIFPGLFVILAAGALAGFHLLMVHTMTGRQLARETDARYIGYGGALIDGAVALSALIIASVGFAGIEQWQAFYARSAEVYNLPSVLSRYIEGFAALAAVLEIDSGFARALAAAALAGLGLSGLDTGLRAQRALIAEAAQHLRLGAALDARKLLIATLLVAVAATIYALLTDARVLWPLFGMASLVVAALGFLFISLGLRRTQHRLVYTLPLAVFSGLIALWALIYYLIRFWTAGDTVAVILTAVLALALVIAAIEAGKIPFRTAKSAQKLDSSSG